MTTLRRVMSFAAVCLLVLSVSPCAYAQQNLFNVPSGIITKPGELFFQEQFNFAVPGGTSNSTFDVGVGNGWEVGVNMLGVSLYDNSGPPSPGPNQVSPDFLFNLQKGFEANEYWDVGIGGQFGFNPDRHANGTKFLNYTWLINEFHVPEHEKFGKWYFGGYYANLPYSGPGETGGFLLGSEIPVIEDKLSFQWDWTTGRNNLGVAVIGGVYTFESSWQLSLGAQVPSPGTQNPYGVVIEFTCPGAKLPLRGRRGSGGGRARQGRALGMPHMGLW